MTQLIILLQIVIIASIYFAVHLITKNQHNLSLYLRQIRSILQTKKSVTLDKDFTDALEELFKSKVKK